MGKDGKDGNDGNDGGIVFFRSDFPLFRAMAGKVGELVANMLGDDDDDEQREATQRVERMYAFVDLMMLAILADGEMLEGELTTLENRLAEAKELDISIGEAKARIRHKAEMVDTPEKMRRAMAVAARRLESADDRELAYQLAVELNRSGSRLGVKRGGYRGNLRHDEGLRDLFAETLGIDEASRKRLENTPLQATSFDPVEAAK
jgi:hypothetical protein